MQIYIDLILENIFLSSLIGYLVFMVIKYFWTKSVYHQLITEHDKILGEAEEFDFGLDDKIEDDIYLYNQQVRIYNANLRHWLWGFKSEDIYLQPMPTLKLYGADYSDTCSIEKKAEYINT